MERCMADDKMTEQFPERDQRYAVCNSYADKSAEYALDPEKGDRPTEVGDGMSGMIATDDGYSGRADESVETTTRLDTVIIEASKYGTLVLDFETVEALQYGRPGKNDPRKTPAKPSERRKGSKKNKPGSAKKPNQSIKVSPETRARLSKMVREHNAKGKGSKASLGRVLSVYRRGAGAFSRSHAPNMSRGGWGIARVKAFLYLLRNGRPSNPNYKQDNDLLPKSHPRAKKASVQAGMEDYIYSTPEGARKKSREIGFNGEIHSDRMADGTMMYFPGPDEKTFQRWFDKNDSHEAFDLEFAFEAAEYQGRKVTLNKPFRTPKGPKKFAVYTKNEKGTVVIVRFGDPNMEIKRDDPQRRKNFRSRHNCDNPGPKWKARYWSCYQWRGGSKVEGSIEESEEGWFFYE